LLKSSYTDGRIEDDLETIGVVAPANVESIRAEFAAVIVERCRRERCRPVLVADFRALQREQCATSNQIVERSNQIAKQIFDQSNQIAEQSIQIAEQSNQIAAQTNQITDLQNMMVEQNEQNHQMQDQIRQIHGLLVSREQAPSADVDERDKRAAKRRRTGR
jgi:septal ring factor EnvC (AmiA/AmiB activator)